MIIEDAEFGEVLVRKNPRARAVKFSISTSGRLAMSVPQRTPDFLVKRYLNASREQIREKLPLKDPRTQRARDYQKKVLEKKAREYLPARLEYWARKYGYKYDKCRLSHAGTRWGSCTKRQVSGGRGLSRAFGSARGQRRAAAETSTISLNIGLMKVPEVLRDYVILHELAHLNHMDHSAAFWAEVEEHDPKYKEHRCKLKGFEPGM